MKSMEDMLIAKNIRKEYKVGEIKIVAVDNISFEIKKGELIVILGPSGAGKTTLLNLIGGMDTATSGELVVNGVDITKFNKKQLTDYRRNQVGFVFQFYNLMPNLTALENVELATELKKRCYDPKQVLTALGLKNRLDNFPSQLSGGEQQRVSIARAIAKNPDIILCDEPTGALDYKTGKVILSILQNICRKNNKTVIIVTHNSALKDMGNKTIHVKNGRIEEIVVNEHPMDIRNIKW